MPAAVLSASSRRIGAALVRLLAVEARRARDDEDFWHLVQLGDAAKIMLRGGAAR